MDVLQPALCWTQSVRKRINRFLHAGVYLSLDTPVKMTYKDYAEILFFEVLKIFYWFKLECCGR